MIVVLKPLLQAAKRQKRFHEPSSRFYKKDAEDDYLGEIGDCDYCLAEDDEEAQEIIEIEEELLDNVSMLHEQYEADSLVRRSSMRAQSNSLSATKRKRFLDKNLEDEKIRCSLLKVFTLLLQTESRLRGSAHLERMKLMQQVKRVLCYADQYSIGKLKECFIKFCTSRKTLFPPHSICVPSSFTSEIETEREESDLSSLISKTLHLMSSMEDASKRALEKRLEQEDYSQISGEDWENIREVWFVWLQFTPRSSNQLAVWEESLDGQQTVNSLLWNLSFYLSIGET